MSGATYRERDRYVKLMFSNATIDVGYGRWGGSVRKVSPNRHFRSSPRPKASC